MSERLKPPQPDNTTPKTGVTFDTTSQISEELDGELELTPQERNQRVYQEKIAKRYNELLQEREDLQKRLLNYDSRYNSGLFIEGMLSDAKVELINSKWLQAVREQTEFLKPLDDLGIKIFTDNLADQPKFSDIKIIFWSAEVKRERIVDLHNIGGLAMQKEVHIGQKNPSLRGQLSYFVTYGDLDDTTKTLIHELIHCYHNESSEYVDARLTEAQAYWSGILARKFSVVDTLKTLTLPEKEGGLYEFDQEKITKILLCIATLNGLGKSEKEIADLIRETKYDPTKNKFSPLEDELEKLMETNGLDEIDTQAARDLYRLHVSNQRQKALVLLDETIEKNMNEEERRRFDKKRIHALQSQFLRMSLYDIDGRAIDPRDEELSHLQFVIVPNTKEFPYEFNGRRTSIAFGLFYNAIKKEPTFELVRSEALGKKTKVELAVTDEEKTKLLGIMKKQAKLISFDSKKHLLNNTIDYAKLLLSDETAKKTLNTFISSGEAKEILSGQQYAQEFLNIYNGMKAVKMNEFKFEESVKEQWEKRIKAYTPMVESYLDYLKIFNLNPNELSPAIAVPLKNIIVWLKNCQEILDKHAKTPISTGLE